MPVDSAGPGIVLYTLNRIGDTLAVLPAVTALQTQTETPLTIVTGPRGKEILELALVGARYLPVADAPKTLSWRGARGFAATAAALRGQRKPSIALHPFDNPAWSYLESWILRIPRRVGFAVGPIPEWLLSEAMPFDPGATVTEQSYTLARSIFPGLPPRPPRPRLSVPDWAHDAVERQCSERGISLGEPLAVLHPGASTAIKRWGMQKFVELRRRIVAELGCQAVLITSEGVNDGSRPEGLSDEPRYVCRSITELAALLQRAAVFVGNNSGPMHLAGMLGTPTVAIHGPSARMWRLQWDDVMSIDMERDDVPCRPCETMSNIPVVCANTAEPLACLERIGVADVLGAVDNLLRAGAAG